MPYVFSTIYDPNALVPYFHSRREIGDYVHDCVMVVNIPDRPRRVSIEVLSNDKWDATTPVHNDVPLEDAIRIADYMAKADALR